MTLKVVLGIDFGGTKIALAASDLAGRCVAQRVVPTAPERGAPDVVARAARAAAEMLAGLVPSAELAGVGVATIGIPGPGGVALAPAIPGWGCMPLARELRAALGAPVWVTTDVKAAAEAEARWGSLKGADPSLYLNLGTGLAAAIVVGGLPLAGAHGASGEIGYNLVCARRSPAPAESQAAGAAAVPERPEVLEATVSGTGLAARASKLTGRPVTAEEVFEGAGVDATLDGCLAMFMDYLCYHLVNLVIAVDPARVAVGGGMVKSWARLQGPLEHALAAAPYPPELVLAARPFDAPLIGALCLAARAAGSEFRHGAPLPVTQPGSILT